jgi:hypothetical protein
MTDHKIFRDDRVHVCARMCKTCIFRPGNLMDLEDGRVEEMVQIATEGNSTIVCHSTLDDPDTALACRGFFDRHPTQSLQIADRLGFVTFVDPPGLTP